MGARLIMILELSSSSTASFLADVDGEGLGRFSIGTLFSSLPFDLSVD
jgi:hypothetical protein